MNNASPTINNTSTTNNLKQCAGPCKRMLEATEENFGVDNSRADHLQGTCKACRKAMREAREGTPMAPRRGKHGNPTITKGCHYVFVQEGPPLKRAVYHGRAANGFDIVREIV